MELIKPDIGTLFWMLLAFSIFFFILKKFAWRPILGFLKNREESIKEALQAADLAKADMEKLQASNEKILSEAKMERDEIIKEARELKEGILNDAKDKAIEEANKILDVARKAIKSEREAAVSDIKKQITTLSIRIAEKLLQEKLGNESEQKELIDKLLSEIKLN